VAFAGCGFGIDFGAGMMASLVNGRWTL